MLRIAAVVALACTLSPTLQSGRPLPGYSTGVPLETAVEDTGSVSIGDLDGDGDLDLVLAKGRHTPILDRVLINDGKGQFVISDLGPTPDRTYTAALVDLDGDRDLDILTSNDAPDQKLVYLNEGKGKFRVAGTWGVPKWPTRNATIADLNGDGRPDVVAANRPGPSYFCLNQGGGAFGAECIAIPAQSSTTIAAADFNKDGSIDLAVPGRDGSQSYIYFNDGKAGFERKEPFGPADATARVAAAADFNRDGAADLVMTDERGASMTVYVNDGKGSVTAGFKFADRKLVPYALTTADLNRDGSADIVIGYINQPSKVFVNDGTGAQFTPVSFGDGQGVAYGFAIGDVNGDGVPDIAMARSGAANVLFLGGK